MLSSAILCELNETVAEAKSIFQKWMLHNETIDPTIKEVVYTAGIKFGGMQEWQFCWNAYNNTHDINERQLLLKALGQPRGDPWLLQRYDFMFWKCLTKLSSSFIVKPLFYFFLFQISFRDTR